MTWFMRAADFSALLLCISWGVASLPSHASDLDAAEEKVASGMNKFYNTISTGEPKTPEQQDALAKTLIEPHAAAVNNVIAEKRETFLNSVLDKVYDKDGDMKVPGAREPASEKTDKSQDKSIDKEAIKGPLDSVKTEDSDGGYTRKAAVIEEKSERPKDSVVLDGSNIPKEVEFFPSAPAPADPKKALPTKRKPATN